jgi:uncharacterized surface protein with fasciclin (FAS1) repeats
MNRSFKLRGAAVLVVALSLVAGACGDDDDSDDASADAVTEETTTTESPSDDAGMSDGGDAAAAPADSAEICDADALVEAVEGGGAEGTLEGMTDDPVGTAASNNPVLTTLTAAVGEAGLVDTLNTAESLTVFAPTDCAFAALDPATMDAAMADPTGLLTQVLGFHVVAGQQLSAEQLAGETSLETFSGGMLPIEASGDEITLNGGQATVVVPDIQTANATVHLIDNVMLPPAG